MDETVINQETLVRRNYFVDREVEKLFRQKAQDDFGFRDAASLCVRELQRAYARGEIKWLRGRMVVTAKRRKNGKKQNQV